MAKSAKQMQPTKKHIDKRTLWVRVMAIVLVLLIAGSALSIIIFGH